MMSKERMVKALAFYALPTHYARRKGDVKRFGPRAWKPSQVDDDGGKRARKALGLEA